MVKVGKNHKAALVHLSHFTEGKVEPGVTAQQQGLSLGPRCERWDRQGQEAR